MLAGQPNQRLKSISKLCLPIYRGSRLSPRVIYTGQIYNLCRSLSKLMYHICGGESYLLLSVCRGDQWWQPRQVSFLCNGDAQRTTSRFLLSLELPVKNYFLSKQRAASFTSLFWFKLKSDWKLKWKNQLITSLRCIWSIVFKTSISQLTKIMTIICDFIYKI